MSDRISVSGTAVLFNELRGQWNEPFVFTNESQVPLWAAVPRAVLRLVEDKKGENMFGKEGCIDASLPATPCKRVRKPLR